MKFSHGETAARQSLVFPPLANETTIQANHPARATPPKADSLMPNTNLK